MPADLVALKKAFPSVAVGASDVLKAMIMPGGQVEFALDGPTVSSQDLDTLSKIVLDFARTKHLPTWLTDEQLAFARAVLEELRKHPALLFWEPRNRKSLRDRDFEDQVVHVSSFTGEVGSFSLVGISSPFTAEDVIGKIEVDPRWFEVRLTSSQEKNADFKELNVGMLSLLDSSTNRWRAVLKSCEFSTSLENHLKLSLFGLENASNWLKGIIDELNTPSGAATDITRNILVRSIAGTEPQAAMDMLAALGLKQLSTPPFQDRERVARLCKAAMITGEQLERNLRDATAGSAGQSTLLGRLGALIRRDVQANREIASYWPARDHQSLCDAIGLRSWTA